MKRKTEIVKHLITFGLTAGLFITIFFVTKIVNERKLSELRSIQDKISIDLLSSETQFSLLKRSQCTQDGNSLLAPEIGKLGERLSFMEKELSADNKSLVNLKQYYSLLQIKDYLLGIELSQECDYKPIYILYFYKNDCSECQKQGNVLTVLRERYPELRVYSFDADLDLSAIATLQSVYKIDIDNAPVLVINEKTYEGFQSTEVIEQYIPELKKMLKEAEETTSGTKVNNKTN